MRAQVADAVRQDLTRELAGRLPQFAPDRESTVPPGWRCWRWSAFEDLHFFLVLHIPKHGDDFSLTCAWGTEPRLAIVDEARVEADEGSFMLHSLWAPRQASGWSASPVAGFDDPTDPLDPDFGELGPVEEAVASVPGLVADAVEKLVTHGLPIFRQVAEAHGRSLDATLD